MKNDDKWNKYGKLLSGLIHNLNTPLMGISGRVELLALKMGPDDKSIKQITTQVERINNMLTAVGYLVDKDQYDKETEIDIATFLTNYFDFMNADMRFKHHVPTKELSFVPVKKIFNPCDLLHCVHTVFDYTLGFIDEATAVSASNTEDGMICISFKFKEAVKAEYDLGTVVAQQIDENIKKVFAIEYAVNGNVVDITIK